MSIDIKTYVILSLVWFLSLSILGVLLFRKWTTQHLPPSPMALPIIGHLHLLAPIPHQALHKLSLRYGPLISLRLGSVPCVVASSAETAKEFLKTHELSFAERPQSKAVSYLTYGSADFSFAPCGAYWRYMRKLCKTQLLGSRTTDMLLPVRRNEIVRFITLLYDKSERRETIHLGRELVKLSNNVISRMAMSRRHLESHENAEELCKLVEETAELMGKFNLADYIGFCKNLDLQHFDKRLEDLHRRLNKMVEGILKDKEEERCRRIETAELRVKDLLDILLDIAEDESAEMKLTKENIKAFILVRFY